MYKIQGRLHTNRNSEYANSETSECILYEVGLAGAEKSGTWAVVLVVITGTRRKSMGYVQYAELDRNCRGAYTGIVSTNAEVDGPMKLSGEALTGNLLAQN